MGRTPGKQAEHACTQRVWAHWPLLARWGPEVIGLAGMAPSSPSPQPTYSEPTLLCLLPCHLCTLGSVTAPRHRCQTLSPTLTSLASVEMVVFPPSSVWQTDLECYQKGILPGSIKENTKQKRKLRGADVYPESSS